MTSDPPATHLTAAAPRKRGKQFTPGNQCSKGRPPGSRNKATLACEQLLEGEAEAITRKLIGKALQGDLTAIRLCLDRVYPPRRERRLKLDLPEIQTADDLANAFRTLMKELAEGNITASQAEGVRGMLEFGRKMIETEDLARGLAEVRVELQEMKENDERRVA